MFTDQGDIAHLLLSGRPKLWVSNNLRQNFGMILRMIFGAVAQSRFGAFFKRKTHAESRIRDAENQFSRGKLMRTSGLGEQK
ncbi:MAG: hypothetical protein A3I05_01685 [Deltaproteobacteria bacterium RIFCSPLOWO2_02_FULL_44_10]|nr:MAG: hypothetical protein A3C46_05280 [Deltaproteobacteria bacterium RIFCSPHIGHO2_02_FULL_44_16]OGQ45360.1 MAG: hypothetical protein A3I05_01685 [Deltaproteobacteria bacterium RIFCSPLOWO2_02_FULL_44_10]